METSYFKSKLNLRELSYSIELAYIYVQLLVLSRNVELAQIDVQLARATLKQQTDSKRSSVCLHCVLRRSLRAVSAICGKLRDAQHARVGLQHRICLNLHAIYLFWLKTSNWLKWMLNWRVLRQCNELVQIKT